MTYYLSLGANIGEREATLHQAIQLIEQQIGAVLRCSSFFYSEPWGFTSVHPFCNLCCLVQTELAPLAMLEATQTIERQLGRTHKSTNGHYSGRTIDIDLILAFDDEGKEIKCQIPNPKSPMSNDMLLVLPHPLYKQRDFVTTPLSEIFDI